MIIFFSASISRQFLGFISHFNPSSVTSVGVNLGTSLTLHPLVSNTLPWESNTTGVFLSTSFGSSTNDCTIRLVLIVVFPALLLPSFVRAVTSAVPLILPVTTPLSLSSNLTTEELLEDHVTFWLALLGEITALSAPTGCFNFLVPTAMNFFVTRS